jgi:hypothetical protein
MSPKYTCRPSERTSSLSNISNIIRDGWWIVHMIAWPLFASFCSKVHIDQAVSLSSADVGSSRKINNSGRAANSTPIVRHFRCSMLRPIETSVGTLLHRGLAVRIFTFTWYANHRLHELLHVREVDNGINIFKLLPSRIPRWLAK